MKMKLLDLAILSLLAGAGPFAGAQPAAAPALPEDTRCDGDGCRAGDGLLFRIESRGARAPVTQGLGARDGDAALQPDRRATVTLDTPAEPPAAPGRATVQGRFTVSLPGGGVVWATVDPTLGRPELSVSSPSLVAVDGGRVAAPVRFFVRSNYPAFIQRMALVLYRADDSALTEPLATLDVPVGAVSQVAWDGTLATRTPLRAGDELAVVLRAWGADGAVDETLPRSLLLVRPEQAERGATLLREAAEKAMGTALSSEQAQRQVQLDDVFRRNDLRQQNILIRGARIRLQGRNLPEGSELRIDGEPYPADLERKFAAEFLSPVGAHSFVLELRGADGTRLQRTLDIEVSGEYLFGVGIADFTLWGGHASGAGRGLAPGADRDGDLFADGRLAFYGKALQGGRLLITAQADTTERDLRRLFSGFTKPEPRDVFRSLDPEQYYPTHGDDSTTTRDVDTQGRFYLRADWDGNEALWGNFATGLTGTEYAQYVRSLYGAALKWRSRGTNPWGEPLTQARAFVSQPATAPGHSEFVGTGGSLYYLRHSDLLPGSELVVLEQRSAATGRIERRTVLQRGVDYEINELQGRLTLSRPLAQTAPDASALTTDTPLGGLEQRLLVDYEWRPAGFDGDRLAAGGRVRQWVTDHVALGATAVDERRHGEDYRLTGADLTLQAGRGTLLRVEHSRSASTGAPVFFSDNGGFSFTQTNAATAAREGSATAVDGRIDLKELGLTERAWQGSAWWRRVDAGYSVARNDSGLETREQGVQLRGAVGDTLSVTALASRAERGAQRLDQARLGAEWRLTEDDTLSAELRRVTEQRGATRGRGLLAGLRYGRRLSPGLDAWGSAQFTLDDDGGRYAANDARALGLDWRVAELATLGAQASDGDRGRAAQVNAEYRLTPEHTLYAAFTRAADRSDDTSFFDPRRAGGWTLGQRWRLGERTQLFSESQSLRSPTGSGLGHTFGLDFYPGVGWSAGFTLQQGTLVNAAGGEVERRAAGVSAGRTSPSTEWRSKLEWRRDSGAEQRRQWVTTNRLAHKLDDDWRVSARFNASTTDDRLVAADGARYAEAGLGIAWRPHDTTRWAWLARYSFVYDLASPGQEGGAQADQKSHVLATEGLWRPDRTWEFAGKLAHREGRVRAGRGSGDWFDSGVSFAALQTRCTLPRQWHALAEYRWLSVKDGGVRPGWLLAVERDLTEQLRIGLGFNFTRFSDDLTKLDYRYRGWFVNVVGTY